MERIIIICEGPTEEEFCKKTLTPYFQKQQIYVQSPLIKHSNGGIVKMEHTEKTNRESSQTGYNSICYFIDRLLWLISKI